MKTAHPAYERVAYRAIEFSGEGTATPGIPILAASTKKNLPVLDLQRKSAWRLDFVSSENSMGFHASQESARILAESIDYSRQAQAAALRLRKPMDMKEAPAVEPIIGVTPKGKCASHASISMRGGLRIHHKS